MKQKSTHTMGAMHPLIFFVIIYGISLFLAIFVCTTVYHAFNDSNAAAMHESDAQQKLAMNSATASAFR